MGSQSVVVCVVNILEARADRVLVKLFFILAATGSQGYSVLLA